MTRRDASFVGHDHRRVSGIAFGTTGVELRMARAKDTVGIVGLGIMGGAFAQNLVNGGWRVIGYDIDAKRRRALGRAGVDIARDVEDVAVRAPTIITSLPNSSALAATAAAIASARARPRVVIEMSTLTLNDKFAALRALQRTNHVMLDCPVSGTGAQAKTKD